MCIIQLIRESRLSLSTVSLVFIILGFIVFSNAIFHPFVHDDRIFIQHNTDIHHLSQWHELFLKPSVFLHNQESVSKYYRPVLEFFYRGQYALFGMNPHGFHFMNILVHVINAILLFCLLGRMGVTSGLAFCTSLFFLLHPVQTESVSCISGISNLAFVFFLLVSFLCYILARNKQLKSQRIGYYIFGLFIFALGLFAKEQIVVLPILILWYELSIRRKENKAWLGLVGYGIVLCAFLFWRHELFPSTFSSIFTYSGELWLRIQSIPETLLMYARVILLPYDLHYYRSLDILSVSFWSLPILLIIGAAFWKIATYFTEKNRDLFIFGWGWFIICLLPVLNIVPIINEYSFILTAEHFLYLPMVGFILSFFVMFVDIAKKLMAENVHGLFIRLMIYGILICGSLTLYYNQFWSAEIPLFERVIRYEPKFGRGRALLARAYHEKGDLPKAVVQYSAALKIVESYVQKAQNQESKKFYLALSKNILIERARAFLDSGRFERVRKDLHKALLIVPSALDYRDSDIHSLFGLSFIGEQNWEHALSHLEKTVRLDNTNILAMNNLGISWASLHEYAKAEKWFKRALEINPSFQSAKDNLYRLSLER